MSFSGEALPAGTPVVDRGPFVYVVAKDRFLVICRTSLPVGKLLLKWRKKGEDNFAEAVEVSRAGGKDHVFRIDAAAPADGEAEIQIFLEAERKLLEIVPGEAALNEPYLFNPGENSISVAWKSPVKEDTRVELRKAGSKAVKSVTARIADDAGNSLLWMADCTGLEAGSSYEYRIVQGGKAGNWYRFSTLKSSGECRMVFFSDIHADKETFRSFIDHLQPQSAEFTVLAGDLCWDGVYEPAGKTFFEDFLNQSIGAFASGVPSVFMRGNHEWAGRYENLWAKYFPMLNGKTYGAFKAGNCCFIVLDTGPIGNFAPGTPAGDCIAEQRKWLKDEVIPSEMFRSSKFKVVLAHMPTHGIPNAPLLEKSFSDLLNDSGVQVMVVGHVHRYMRINRNDDGCYGTDYYTIWSEKNPPRSALDKNYTLVINGGGPDENGRFATALEMKSSASSLHFRVIRKDGSCMDEFRIMPDGKVENISPAKRFLFRGEYKK